MSSNVYDVFYPHCSYKHVLAAITVIFRMMLLLYVEYKGTDVVSCVTIAS